MSTSSRIISTKAQPITPTQARRALSKGSGWSCSRLPNASGRGGRSRISRGSGRGTHCRGGALGGVRGAVGGGGVVGRGATGAGALRRGRLGGSGGGRR